VLRLAGAITCANDFLQDTWLLDLPKVLRLGGKMLVSDPKAGVAERMLPDSGSMGHKLTSLKLLEPPS
jgi:hypothetical protein